MTTKAITLRLPTELLALAEQIGREQNTSRAAILRQWLYRGAEEPVLDLVEEGRISRGQAYLMLDITPYEFLDMVQKYGKGYGGPRSEEELQESLDNLHRVFPLPEKEEGAS